jgi:hypothetical protein
VFLGLPDNLCHIVVAIGKATVNVQVSFEPRAIADPLNAADEFRIVLSARAPPG